MKLTLTLSKKLLKCFGQGIKKRTHLEEPDVKGTIILKRMLAKEGVKA